jgi:hypothetical protein
MSGSSGMDMDMGGMTMMGTTNDECYATNTAWLQTMAYCIQQNCRVDGYPAEKQAKCFSTQAVAGASKPTFQDSLPATAPTVELSKDAVWLNVTSLVNRDVYYNTHGTLGEFARSEYIHTRYAYVFIRFLVSDRFIPPFRNMRLTKHIQGNPLSHRHWYLHCLWCLGPNGEYISRISEAVTKLYVLVKATAVYLSPCSIWVSTSRTLSWKRGLPTGQGTQHLHQHLHRLEPHFLCRFLPKFPAEYLFLLPTIRNVRVRRQPNWYSQPCQHEYCHLVCRSE